MKYLSYLIIVTVMTVIAWSTNITIGGIIKTHTEPGIEYYEEKLQSVETKSNHSILDELLGS